MSTVIKVENVSKSYILSHKKQQYELLGDTLINKAKSIFSGQNKNHKPQTELFWALNDISFDVKNGDRVGIIGRNGAGKSTLLKILSRITEPTKGRVSIKGRVASLLEVGTGFHPELTGRENIFLNGSILGMSKVEIKSKFDEIVAFAEVEKFLDTPVKRYSSGMYVRLAFAVAAHLEPEILIVDEVLAVGDAQFQSKCLGKMEDVSKNQGRTVLFVTHNMAALSLLCTNSILLKDGKIIDNGPTEKVISTYLSRSEKGSGGTIDDSASSPNAKLKIRFVKVLNNDLSPASEINNANKGFVEVGFEVLEEGRGYDVSIELKHLQYGSILTSCLKDFDTESNDKKVWTAGIYKYLIELPLSVMRGGDYLINAAATIPKIEVLDIYKYETTFHVVDSVSPVVKTTEGRNGAILPVIEWERI